VGCLTNEGPGRGEGGREGRDLSLSGTLLSPSVPFPCMAALCGLGGTALVLVASNKHQHHHPHQHPHPHTRTYTPRARGNTLSANEAKHKLWPTATLAHTSSQTNTATPLHFPWVAKVHLGVQCDNPSSSFHLLDHHRHHRCDFGPFARVSKPTLLVGAGQLSKQTGRCLFSVHQSRPSVTHPLLQSFPLGTQSNDQTTS
jgi:hypothetical protein